MLDKRLRIGALASHAGTNLQAIIDACKQRRLSAEICVVISNNSRSSALARTRREGIPAYHLSAATHPEPTMLDTAICEHLQRHAVDVVLLTGYMKLLGGITLSRYRNRVLNSHPALLPKFGGKGMYGSHVHQAVLDAGERVTGVTIHQVDEQYDHGKIVAQCCLSVLPNDTLHTLEERVKQRERQFWVETLDKIATGEINMHA